MSAVSGKNGSVVPEPATFIVNVAADISVHHDNGFGLTLAVEGRQHHGVGNRVLGGRSTQGLGSVCIANRPGRYNQSVGRARFIITVNDPATGEPVNGAEIVIRIKHQAEGTEGWAAAYSVPTFPGTYHAQTRFDSPGVYLVSIEIQGELGKGTVLVEPLNVPDLRGYSSGSIVFVALTLVLVAGAVYIFWNAAREKKRREALAVSAGPSGKEPAGQGGQGPGGDGRD